MTLSSQKKFSKVENNNEQRINLKQKFRFLLLLFGDIVCKCVCSQFQFKCSTFFSKGKILFIMFHHHHSLNIVFVFKNKTKNLPMFFLCFGHQKKKKVWSFDEYEYDDGVFWLNTLFTLGILFFFTSPPHTQRSWSGFSPFIFRILSCCCCCCLNFNGTTRKKYCFLWSDDDLHSFLFFLFFLSWVVRYKLFEILCKCFYSFIHSLIHWFGNHQLLLLLFFFHWFSNSM